MALEKFQVVDDENSLKDVFFLRGSVVAIESRKSRYVSGVADVATTCVTRRVHLASGIYFDVVDDVDGIQFRRLGL